ncbi:MAG: sugar-transfer associated ATP-grasp domain-containing protein [Candidatus Dojkabacteria bacterium]
MGVLRMWQNRRIVLGMNERNLSYISRYNSKKSKNIADNKLITKRVLNAADIPNPELIGAIRNHTDLYSFDWESLPRSFVIKPVRGLEGGGIEIFFNRDNEGNWIKADGSRYSLQKIQALAGDIIDGKYSLHGESDSVFFEERVRMHKGFKYYAYKGVPDIRVVVFDSVPVMGMLRLPTRASEGKGNLAMGAIGAGIDISSGVTTTGIIGKSIQIERIPGTKLSVSGLKIPFWNRILYYAIAAQRESGLKFAGIDFLIDRDKGPMVIEINARPGLSIQLANDDGMRWRLRKARGIRVQSIEKGIRLSKDLFGGSIEEDIERISGKTLIGLYEDVQFSYLEDRRKQYKTKAKIDTGADSTSIDENVMRKLGYDEYLDNFAALKQELNIPEQFESKKEAREAAELINKQLETFQHEHEFDVYCQSISSSHGTTIRLVLEIELELGGYKYRTYANAYDRSKLNYKAIIGRKSLSRFLVEPSRQPFSKSKGS